MAERTSRHRTIAIDVDEPTGEVTRRELSWPWWLVAVVGAVAVVAAGWLLMAGASLLGWVNAPETELTSALQLATQVLVLAFGAPVVIGGQAVSLTPLTLTLAMVLLGQPVAAMAARQLAQRQATADDTGALWVDGQALVFRVAGTFALVQAATLLFVGMTVDEGANAWQAGLGGLVVGALAGVWGASRAIGHDPRRNWPAWLRAVPEAMGSALLLCVAGGAAVIGSTLFLNQDRVAAIHDTLQPDLAGTILLVVVQLLYLPNLVLWGTAWALGGGITLGDGSLLNLNVTDVGFLPAIPVLGGIPEPGLAPGTTFAWLLVGVAAGILAAVLVVARRPRARFDETAAAGGLSGVAAGLLVVLLCSGSSGGLGAARLSHMGPELLDLLIVAPSILGLSGLLAGLVLGLLRRPAAPTA